MNELDVRILSPAEVADLPRRLPDARQAEEAREEVAAWLGSVQLCQAVVDRTCYLACEGDRPVGYLLGYIHHGEGHCTAVTPCGPASDRPDVASGLVRAFVRGMAGHEARSCWFAIGAGRLETRQALDAIGAHALGVRRGALRPGDQRWVARMGPESVARLRS